MKKKAKYDGSPRFDFNGQQLKVGQIVTYGSLNYRSLENGIVEKINDKMVTIQATRNTGRFNRVVRQFHCQVVISPDFVVKNELAMDVKDRLSSIDEYYDIDGNLIAR